MKLNAKFCWFGREDSGVYIAHYYTDFMGLYLRSTLCKVCVTSSRMARVWKRQYMKMKTGFKVENKQTLMPSWLTCYSTETD